MFYKFSFKTLRIMSDLKYVNAEVCQEMLERYYEEQDVALKNALFLPEDYEKMKRNSFLTAFSIGYKTWAYICVTPSLDYVYFVKDNKGFRFDISEKEFHNFVQNYSNALVALRDKINNGLYLDKFVLNDETRNSITQLLDLELGAKNLNFNYDDYEYL